MSAAAGASSQFRADAARTGAYSGPAVAEPKKARWKYAVGELAVSSPPAVHEGLWVVTSRKGGVALVDRAKGKLAHAITLGAAGGSYASPAVADGTAYVVERTAEGHEGCGLFAVDLATRAVRWRCDVGEFGRSSPTIAGDTVLVGANRALLALDRATGAERWRYEAPGDESVFAPASVTGTVVLCGTQRLRPSHSGHAVALDLATGALRWRVSTGPTDWMSALATDGETVFVPTGSGCTVRALAVADGATKWSAKCPGGAWAAPALFGGTVFAGDYEGVLHALDARTGAERWTHAVSKKPFAHGPAVHDGGVYAGAGKALCALGLDGSPRWEWKAPKELSCAPVLFDGQLVVGCSDVLVAL